MPEQISRRLGMLLTSRINDLGLTVSDLARKLADIGPVPSMNHIRRICNGEVFPSSKVLAMICTYLKIDLKEAERLSKLDRADHKGFTRAFTGKDDLLIKLEGYWSTLSQRNRMELVELAKFKAMSQAKKKS